MKKEKASHKTRIYIVFAIIALAIIGIACFCINSAYHKGYYDGHANYESETTESLVRLGNAISEKTEFIKNSDVVLKDVPSEIEEEGIDIYISNLTTLNNSIHTEAVKQLLESFIKDWQEFKETYASEDNDAITAKFNELKTKATTLSNSIREIFDNEITSAVKTLNSEQ